MNKGEEFIFENQIKKGKNTFQIVLSQIHENNYIILIVNK
jgi:hypothetical protein